MPLHFARRPGGPPPPPALGNYATIFPIVENPLSDGGAWGANTDSHTTRPRVSASGKCHGTQAGGSIDDSQDWMSAGRFPRNVRITAKIFRTSASSSPNREVELLYAMSNGVDFTGPFGTFSTYGYEFNLHATGAYANVGRFALLPAVDTAASIPSFGDGSILIGDCVWNGLNQPTFRFTLDGSPIIWTTSGTDTVTDTAASPPNGQPGIGFFIDAGAANDTFGFSSLQIAGL